MEKKKKMATYEQLFTLSNKLGLDKKTTSKVMSLLERDLNTETLVKSMEKLLGKEKADKVFELTGK